jgi:DNA-binding MarR family transcriptional regulator
VQTTSAEADTQRATHTVEVVNGFRRILRSLRQASSETQVKAGVSAAQLFVLTQLAQADVLSVNDLAERTLTDRSSVASVVDRLVERGLAARTRSPRDRRRAAIACTAAGRRLVRQAPPPPTKRLLHGLKDLEEQELNELARLLTRLVHAMGLESAHPTMLFEGDTEQPAQKRRRVEAT